MTDLVERVDRGVAPPSRPAHQAGPRRRPPAALRALAGIAALGAALFTAALMLSDRAPGVLERLFGDRARSLWERVDATGRADFVTAERVPESDNLVHIAVWAVVMLLIGITVWSWRWLIVAAPILVGASAVVEVGQGRWADTRSVEASDIVANGTGIVIGTVAAGVLYVCWTAAVALFGRHPAR